MHRCSQRICMQTQNCLATARGYFSETVCQAFSSLRTPRQVTTEYQPSVVILTDACYERDSRDRICGLGGVLCDNLAGTKLFFSCQLDAEQRNVLGEPCRKQIIFEAETLLCGACLQSLDREHYQQEVLPIC